MAGGSSDDLDRQLGRALRAAIGAELAAALGSLRLPAEPAPPVDEPLRFLTTKQVAERIGLEETSVRALIGPGKPFAAIKQGRSLRIASEQVLAYQREQMRLAAGGEVQGEAPNPIDEVGARRKSAWAKGRARTAQDKKRAR